MLKLSSQRGTLISFKLVCERFKHGVSEPIVYPDLPDVLIYNATLFIKDKWVKDGYLWLSKGKIKKIGTETPPMDVKTRVDAQGSFVSPGLIDMHSHAGVHGFPTDASGNTDVNEMTHPTFAAVRAIDAYNPHDAMIHDILKAGVTSMQILPGSGNVMGGEGFMVKLYGRTVEEMRIKNAPKALKMACGENPKGVYGRRGLTPMSRMGSGYLMREILSNATKLYQKQKDYCEGHLQADQIPSDLFLDILVDLLKGNVILNIHCYKVVDMEMAIRVASEFGVKIAAFHHASEAYLIADVLKQHNISVAIFSDNWAFKLESYEGSIHAGKILDEKGVNVVYKTDHPVIHGRDLLYQAQKATHWGLDPISAIQSVTANAAKAMGILDRVGTLEQGKDADVVIWDRHPLHLGAAPLHVFIEGRSVYESSKNVRSDLMSYTPSYGVWRMEPSPENACKLIEENRFHLNEYIITNANIFDGEKWIMNGMVSVNDGIVTCVGKDCNSRLNATMAPVSFNLNNGTIIPGMIMGGMLIGQSEIDQESSFKNGRSKNVDAHVVDGVTIYGKHVEAAWKDGILTAVSIPDSASMITGSSSAFHMGPGIDTQEYIVNSTVSLDIHIGNSAKSDLRSVSDQITALRKQFQDTLVSEKETLMKRAVQGEIPIVFWVDSADYILSIVRILDEVFTDPETTPLKIVFANAAEAHLVVDQIKKWNASVYLRRCYPQGFETRRCDYGKAIETFKQENVLMGVMPLPKNSAMRGLRWEAGLAMEHGLTFEESISLVTSNIATMYNLEQGVGRIQEGQPVNMVGFTGNPLSFTNIEFIGIRRNFQCKPVDDEF